MRGDVEMLFFFITRLATGTGSLTRSMNLRSHKNLGEVRSSKVHLKSLVPAGTSPRQSFSIDSGLISGLGHYFSTVGSIIRPYE